jgi:hypothetical protein
MKKTGSEKLILTILSSLFLGSLLFPLVSAAAVGETMGQVVSGFTDAVTPIFEKLLGNTPGGDYLFAKFLFFVIILSIVWVVLEKTSFFGEHPQILVIGSVAVALLSTRYIGNETIIGTILLPYSVFGITITSLIPFLLFFLTFNVGMPGPNYSSLRRIAWICFAVVFMGMWFVRDDLPYSVGLFAAWIYFGTAALALLVCWLDGTLQVWILKRKMQSLGATDREDAILKLRGKIEELITAAEHARLKRKYEKEIAKFVKG